MQANVETFFLLVYPKEISFNPLVKFVRYDNLRAFEKHLEGAKLLHFNPLYFIVGKDAFESQEAISLLLRYLIPSAQMKEVSLSILDGSSLEEGELSTALSSCSLFVKNQVILIQQAEKLKKHVQEKLEKYLAHPSSALYLILSATNWQKSSSFYKAAEKAGIILEFIEIKPWEKEKKLIEWVNKQASALRKIISYPVCQALVKGSGTDLASLSQEFDKLICYSIDKKEITLQDVEAICSNKQVESVWQLGEALFNKQTAHALHIACSLLIEGQLFLPLLRQIRSQFQTEYQISLLIRQGKQAADITQEFPYMKGQILERHLKQAEHYGSEAFKKGLLAIDYAEIRSKNSSIDEKILLELLIVQLTT